MESLTDILNLLLAYLNSDLVGASIGGASLMIMAFITWRFVKKIEEEKNEDDQKKKYLGDINRLIKKNKKSHKDLFDAIRYVNDWNSRLRGRSWHP